MDIVSLKRCDMQMHTVRGSVVDVISVGKFQTRIPKGYRSQAHNPCRIYAKHIDSRMLFPNHSITMDIRTRSLEAILAMRSPSGILEYVQVRKASLI